MTDPRVIINDAYLAMALLRVRVKPNDKALLDAILKITAAVEVLEDLTVGKRK